MNSFQIFHEFLVEFISFSENSLLKILKHLKAVLIFHFNERKFEFCVYLLSVI